MRAKKELVLKCLIELCVLRCIRPDKISESFDKFISIVVDTHQNTNASINSSPRNQPNLRLENHNSSTERSKGEGKKAKKDAPKISSFISLLKEAYDDSTKGTPIFFLITHCKISNFNTFSCSRVCHSQ